MLLELRVENLLLIERAELRLERGLNVVTGETGAGKTVLAHALDLLLGGKARTGVVRPGAKEAYVEGVFALDPALLEDESLGELRERLPDDAEEIVLARRVGAEGRTRAFIQGRSASAADLSAVGSRLLAFYGQHEHRRLTLGSAQLEILDGFCGPKHLETRARYRAAHERVRALKRELEQARERAGTRERDRDLLAFELDEIDALEPSEDEKEGLLAERSRLRRVDALREAAATAAEALAPDGADAEAGVAALAAAERTAAGVSGADQAFDALVERVTALRIEAEDLAGDLRAYLAGIEADPERLLEVESRLDLYDRLERKHGGDVAAVLRHAERCRAELDALERSEENIGTLEAELAEAGALEAELARALSDARASGASTLAARVEDELGQLAMEGASFEVALEPRDELAPSGAERAEFLIAANAGVAAAPLRETASGGELSRAMLALLGAARTEGDRTFVFDEVDAGIGGQTARAVGERLRALAGGTQVICITHLPQIASLADRHFRIEKAAKGKLARTSVELLDDDAVVGELCRMLGADMSDPGARRHAEELLALAA